MLEAGSGDTASAVAEGAGNLKLVRHGKMVTAEYVLMIACSLSAVIAGHLDAAGQTALIILWVIVYTSLIVAVHRLEARRGSDETAKTA